MSLQISPVASSHGELSSDIRLQGSFTDSAEITRFMEALETQTENMFPPTDADVSDRLFVEEDEDNAPS